MKSDSDQWAFVVPSLWKQSHFISPTILSCAMELGKTNCCLSMLVFLLFSTASATTTVKLTTLHKVLGVLGLRGPSIQPLLLCRPENLQVEPHVPLHHVRVLTNLSHLNLDQHNEEDLVICHDHWDQEDIEDIVQRLSKHGWQKTLLMLTQQQSNFSSLPFLRMFVFNMERSEVTENFCINEVCTNNLLATINNNQANEAINLMESRGFLERRSNLQGLRLRVVLGLQRPYLSTKSPLDLSSRLLTTPTGDIMLEVDVSELQGSFEEMFRFLRGRMNFSCQALYRQDEVWGHQLPDGNWSGIISTMVKGEADLVVGPLTITYGRSQAVHFLPGLAAETFALFVKKEGREELSLMTFFKPFTYSLWVGIAGCSFFLALSLTILELLANAKEIEGAKNGQMSWGLLQMYKLGHNMWKVVNALFGGRAVDEEKSKYGKSFQSYRLLIFFTGFFGVIILACFRSSITSELSVRKEWLPFTGPESLLQSNYMVTGPELFAQSLQLLLQSGLDNTTKIALEERFLDNSIEIEDVEERFFSQPRLAYFFTKEILHLHEDLYCKLTISWENSKLSLSFALPQKSPFEEFMQFHAINLLELGINDIADKKWRRKIIACDSSNISLTIEKLSFPFGLMMLTFVVAFMLWLCEMVHFLLHNIARKRSKMRNALPIDEDWQSRI